MLLMLMNPAIAAAVPLAHQEPGLGRVLDEPPRVRGVRGGLAGGNSQGWCRSLLSRARAVNSAPSSDVKWRMPTRGLDEVTILGHPPRYVRHPATSREAAGGTRTGHSAASRRSIACAVS